MPRGSTDEAQNRLAKSIDDMCTKEYPLLIAFIPNREQFTKGAGEKVASRINAFIQEVNADSAHEVRYKFDNAVTSFIDRLNSDPVLRNKIEAIKLEIVHDQNVADYVKNIGNDLKSWLSDDLHQPHSKLQEKISAAVAGLGTTLLQNDGLKVALNEHLETLVVHYGDTLRTAIAGHITGTVQKVGKR